MSQPTKCDQKPIKTMAERLSSESSEEDPRSLPDGSSRQSFKSSMSAISTRLSSPKTRRAHHVAPRSAPKNRVSSRKPLENAEKKAMKQSFRLENVAATPKAPPPLPTRRTPSSHLAGAPFMHDCRASQCVAELVAQDALAVEGGRGLLTVVVEPSN